VKEVSNDPKDTVVDLTKLVQPTSNTQNTLPNDSNLVVTPSLITPLNEGVNVSLIGRETSSRDTLVGREQFAKDEASGYSD